MFIQRTHHASTFSTNLNTQNTRQHQRGSTLSYLGPQKAQHLLKRTMDKEIHDVANGPSTSNSNRLDSLLALKSRDYQNAPGSNLVLSYKGGLPGGGKRVNIYESFSSTSSVNNYRNISDDGLREHAQALREQADRLLIRMNRIGEGPEKQQLRDQHASLMYQHNGYLAEWARRIRRSIG